MSTLDRESVYETLRNHHRARIVRQFCLHGELSLKRLVGLTGFSRSSLVNHVRRLEAEGLLRVAGLGPSTGGRREQRWCLNPDAHWFGGIALSAGRLSWELINIRRTRVESGQRPLRRTDQGAVVNRLSALIQRLRDRAAQSKAELSPLTLTVKGIVHPHAGIIFAMDEYPDWRNLALTQLWDFGIPIHLINHTSALLIENKWTADPAQPQSAACLHIGNLLQVAVMRNGSICRGEIGTDIDIGHVQVATGGRRCHCGRRGCLLTVATKATFDRDLEASPPPDGREHVHAALMTALSRAVRHVQVDFGVDRFLIGGYPASFDPAMHILLTRQDKRLDIEWLAGPDDGPRAALGAAFRSLEAYLNIATFLH